MFPPCEPVPIDAVTKPARERAGISAERMRALRDRRRNAPSEVPESRVSALIGTLGRLQPIGPEKKGSEKRTENPLGRPPF